MDNSLSKYYDGGARDAVLTELFSGTLPSEDSSDHIIPDYIPDAEKVLLCTAKPKLEASYISGSTLQLDGNVSFELLLATEGGTLSSLTLNEPFSYKGGIEGLSEDCRISLTPKVGHLSAKLVNPRKINLRRQIDTKAEIYRDCPTEPQMNGDISLEDDMRLCRKIDTVKTADIVFCEEKDIKVSRDIELDGSSPQAEELILCRVRLTPSEVRADGANAEVKSDAAVSFIYRTDDGGYYSAEKKFSLVGAVPVGDFIGEWNAVLTAGNISAKVVPNSYGEMKTVELDFDYDISLTGMRNLTAEAVSDIYSTEYECTHSLSDESVTVFKRRYTAGLSVNSSVPRSEAGEESIASVFTGGIGIKGINSEYNTEKHRIVTEGILDVNLVCEGAPDENGEKSFSAVKYEYPFKCETDTQEELSDAYLTADVTVTDTRYRADSQNLCADVELLITVTALEKNTVSYISEAELDKNSPISRSTAPITLCYPTFGETLWDVAKEYSITVESIIEANSLDSGSIENKKVLLIPRMTAKSAVI